MSPLALSLYDEFGLGSKGETRSATEVPYFEGDYWPGAAEESISGIKEEAAQRRRGGKKAKR